MVVAQVKLTNNFFGGSSVTIKPYIPGEFRGTAYVQEHTLPSGQDIANVMATAGQGLANLGKVDIIPNKAFAKDMDIARAWKEANTSTDSMSERMSAVRSQSKSLKQTGSDTKPAAGTPSAEHGTAQVRQFALAQSASSQQDVVGAAPSSPPPTAPSTPTVSPPPSPTTRKRS